jgi:hypothetical protein
VFVRSLVSEVAVGQALASEGTSVAGASVAAGAQAVTSTLAITSIKITINVCLVFILASFGIVIENVGAPGFVPPDLFV